MRMQTEMRCTKNAPLNLVKKNAEHKVRHF